MSKRQFFSLLSYFSLVCGFKVHRRCAVRAKNNCKWTTVQSLKREHCEFDESDPVSFMYDAVRNSTVDEHHS